MSDLRTAAQQALEALAAYRREMGDRQPCDAETALRAALKREEEALACLEERKQHWRRERERMQTAPECPHGSDEACKLCYLEQLPQ